MKQIITIFLLLSMLQIHAQIELSMIGAIEKALETNYDIRIQQMDSQIASMNNNWGTAGRYPSVTATVNSNNKRDFNENDNYNQFQLLGGVNLNWVLFDGFRVNITKQKLEELENLTKGFTSILVEGTIQSVINAYNKVLLQEEILKVYKENVQLSADRFEYEKLKKELGNAVSYQVLQVQNALLQDQSDVLLQEANVKAAMRDLAFIMGLEKAEFILSDKLFAMNQEFNDELLKIQMIEQNKTLKNQYINQTLLAKDIESVRAGLYPKLSLNAGAQIVNFNQNFADLPDISSNSSNVFGNFTLSYSIFNGGVRKRAIEIAKIEEEIGMVAIDEMKISLSNQLDNLLDYFTARKSILNLAEERLKFAKINLDISEDKLKAGTINSFNFRDVQLNYQNASISRLNAIYNYNESRIAIQRITGQIISEE